MTEKETVRKEVYLLPSTINQLQILADKKQWSLKKYMENTLLNESKKALKLKQQ
jgi:hypothetical protein